MRLKIRHDLTYRFDPPARGVVHTYRLNPRNHDGQHVVDWRIDTDVNCRIKFGEDGFGNLTQAFTADGPLSSIAVSVECKIDTTDTAGFVRGAVERFPPQLYLRTTDLTRSSNEMRAFAEDACSQSVGTIAKLHALLPAVCNAVD
jgi:transglutaminase-like putative cysteine protease